jgi:hypothetical protein
VGWTRDQIGMLMSDDDYDPNEDAALTSGFSDTGDERADAVSNTTGGGYERPDAAAETGSTGTQASNAWHTARDDYEDTEGLDDRHTGGWDNH